MRIEPAELSGRVVRLVPARAEHAEDLAAAAEPGLLDLVLTRPTGPGATAMRAFVEQALASPTQTPLVVLEAATGRAVGMSNYFSERPDDLACEVGGTWIARRLHGGAANPEMKLLMLGHAFERAGVRRVQLRADAINARSIAAIEKIGARYEGTLRRHIPIRDAAGAVLRLRDTVVYSVIDDEWPGVRARLDDLLRRRSTVERSTAATNDV